MALTADQQAQVDMAIAIEAARHTNQVQLINNQQRMEAVRLAKEILVENARNQTVDAPDITASDVTTFADTLVTYISGE
jgi:hypothetical protein